MNRILSINILLIIPFALFAQSSVVIEMADTLRSSGKIYVVVAIIAITFIVLAFYLFSIDKKIKRIEKDK